MALWNGTLFDGNVGGGASGTQSAGASSSARIGLFPQVQIFWDDAVTVFNGFALFGLIPPTLQSVSYEEGDFGLTYPSETLPQFAKVPIVNGYLNGSTGLYYNEDISPPNTTYNVRFYDTTKRLIVGPSDPFTVASNRINSIPAPVLETPSAGGDAPSPDN